MPVLIPKQKLSHRRRRPSVENVAPIKADTVTLGSGAPDQLPESSAAEKRPETNTIVGGSVVTAAKPDGTIVVTAVARLVLAALVGISVP
ncbi:hypothetical protein DQ04_12841020 [Trypanosoma grayi]|uniref:hypothetical protein n=1 Tax=Trypanosoma grayi TaxID=71804 RepID=UPI0004F43BAD|nr:hypothetical protein DQ04_12841020 [Trypanosoma grayi]KEG06664.1 hypothetical protein DQ04_12841020 [Trypanosoma grayi]